MDEDEFERIYSRFQAGKYQFDITQTEFDVDEYTKFCDDVADETAEFQTRQEEATAIETEKFASPHKFCFIRLLIHCFQGEAHLCSVAERAKG